MASENIMMDAVKKGVDRQVLHEKIRTDATEAGRQGKEKGLENDLIERVIADPDFGLNEEDVTAILVPDNFTGRSEQQVEEFVANCVKPVLDNSGEQLGETAELSV